MANKLVKSRRFGVADPHSEDYMGIEAFINNVKLIPIKNGTERAVAVALVDRNGDHSESNKSSNITQGGVHKLSDKRGVLERIVFNKALASSVITMYDSLTGSGEKIGTITLPATLLQSQFTLEYGLKFQTGLTIVTSGTDDITVIFN